MKLAAIWLIPVFILGGIYGYFILAVYPRMSGDLGKLGKIPFGQEYDSRLLKQQLSDNRVIEYPGDSISGEVLTIGDSFSQAKEKGYQNFLAHQLGEPVTNISLPIGTVSPINVSFGLFNSGFFKIHKNIKFVIVERVERCFVEDIVGVPFDYNLKDEYENIQEIYGSEPQGNTKSDFKQARDWALIHAGMAESPVHDVPLTKKCFTMLGKEDHLYFYDDDLIRTNVSDDEMKTIKEKLAYMESQLSRYGIQLIFVVVPDKYEIYQSYTVDNPFPHKNVGDKLLELNSLGYFFTPIKEIKQLIDSGVPDVYLANDTHWSQLGAEVVATQLADKIRQYRSSRQ